MPLKSKALKVGVAAALVAVAAYWYWSPLLAVHQMRTAAQAGDADTFNDHVDYPRLRDSMKGQLSASLTKKMASELAPDNEFAKAGAALGAMLGLSMVDKMVDAFVRPETVMRAMQQGKLAPKRSAEPTGSAPASGQEQQVVWKSERKGVDKYIAYGLKSGETDDQRIALVMERSGFANWKLTEIRLPNLD